MPGVKSGPNFGQPKNTNGEGNHLPSGNGSKDNSNGQPLLSPESPKSVEPEDLFSFQLNPDGDQFPNNLGGPNDPDDPDNFGGSPAELPTGPKPDDSSGIAKPLPKELVPTNA